MLLCRKTTNLLTIYFFTLTYLSILYTIVYRPLGGSSIEHVKLTVAPEKGEKNPHHHHLLQQHHHIQQQTLEEETKEDSLASL